MSCGSPTFCVAVDGDGSAYTFDGASWTGPVAIDAPNEVSSVSCPSASFCAGVDQNGQGHGDAVMYNGVTWSAPKEIDPTDTLQSVSCPTTAFCAAVAGGGDALTYSGISSPTSVGRVGPSTGPAGGGTSVTISGAGFAPGDTVAFGAVAATGVTVTGTSSITATAPPGAAGTVDVSVTAPSGPSATNPADRFTYTDTENPAAVPCSPVCTDTVSTPSTPRAVTATGLVGDLVARTGQWTAWR